MTTDTNVKKSNVKDSYRSIRWSVLSVFIMSGMVYFYFLFVEQDITRFYVKMMLCLSIVAPYPFLVLFPRISLYLNTKKTLEHLRLQKGHIKNVSKVFLTEKNELGVFITEKTFKYKQQKKPLYDSGRIQKEPLKTLEERKLSSMYQEYYLSILLAKIYFKKYLVFLMCMTVVTEICLYALGLSNSSFEFKWDKFPMISIMFIMMCLIVKILAILSDVLAGFGYPAYSASYKYSSGDFSIKTIKNEKILIQNFKSNGLTIEKVYQCIDGSRIFKLSRNGNHVEYCLVPLVSRNY